MRERFGGMSRRRLLIAGAGAAVGVIIIIVLWFLLTGDTPPPATLESARESVRQEDQQTAVAAAQPQQQQEEVQAAQTEPQEQPEPQQEQQDAPAEEAQQKEQTEALEEQQSQQTEALQEDEQDSSTGSGDSSSAEAEEDPQTDPEAEQPQAEQQAEESEPEQQQSAVQQQVQEPEQQAQQQSSAESAPPSLADLAGAWTLSERGESFVGYRIGEELARIGTATAVGRTGVIEAALEFDGAAITSVVIQADLRTLRSDESFRDNALRTRGLQSDTYPFATFTLTEPVVIGALPSADDVVQIDCVQGTLELHGVTNEVCIALEGQLLDGELVVVVGSTEIVLADYEIEKPTGFSVLSIEDAGIMEFQLIFERAP